MPPLYSLRLECRTMLAESSVLWSIEVYKVAVAGGLGKSDLTELLADRPCRYIAFTQYDLLHIGH